MAEPRAFISIDPGLPRLGVATWRAESTRHRTAEQRLDSVRLIVPDGAADHLATRLAYIYRWALDLARYEAHYAAYVERPAQGGMYRRSGGMHSAVQASLYLQHLASGAMQAGFAMGSLPVVLLTAPTMPKKRKQALAANVIAAAGLRPDAGRSGRSRSVWTGEELDAVFVGLQAIAG